jgi:hypothetical protein
MTIYYEKLSQDIRKENKDLKAEISNLRIQNESL